MKKPNPTIYSVILSILFIAFVAISTNAQTGQTSRKSKVQKATVLITEQGYSKSTIKLKRGVPVQITFLRQTDKTCATEVVVAEYGVRRPVPLNVPTVIAFTPKRNGEFSFACGMNMMRGKLIIQ